MRLRSLSACAALLWALSGCGGGGDGAPAPVAAAIVTQPASTAVTAGAPISFAVTTQGDGLSYQWQRDGVDVPGATGASVAPGSAQLADDGSRWSVTIKSASGTLASSVATLTVNPVKGISVVAGMAGGYGNADGPVGRLEEPTALAIDRDGVLYAGTFGAAVRRIAPGANGIMAVSTRWSGVTAPAGLAVDAAGNLIGIIGNRIVRIAPDGTQTTLAGGDNEGSVDGAGAQARFDNPSALALDSAGLIYVAERGAIRTVTAAGVVGTDRVATAALADQVGLLYGMPMYVFQRPTGLAFDSAGNLVIATSGGKVRKVTPAGARLDTQLTASTAVAADHDGNLYGVTQCALYKADAAGNVTLLAGSPTERGAVDGAGAAARFGSADFCLAGIVADASDNVFLTDGVNHTLRKITPAGLVTTVAGKAVSRGLVDGAGTAARLSDGAHDLTFDGKATLYLVQEGKVRKVTRAGAVTTLNLPAVDGAGNPVTYFTGGMAFQGQPVGVANRVVYLVDESGAMRVLAGSPTVPGGTDGNGAQAGFGDICGVTRDGAGNLYLLDCYSLLDANAVPIWNENRIRKVTPAGVVSTLYAVSRDDRLHQPWHIVADRQGNVSASTLNSAVTRIAAAGAVSFTPVDSSSPQWLAADGAGNLLLANAYLLPTVVEKIGADGRSQVIAGSQTQFGLIEGPLPGSLNLIYGITVDDRGVVYVLTENAVVRLVQ